MQWQSTILTTTVTPGSVKQTTTQGMLPDRVKWRLLYLDVEATVRSHRQAVGTEPDLITIFLEKCRFEPTPKPTA